MGIKTIMASAILGLGISGGAYLLSNQPFYKTTDSQISPNLSGAQILKNPFVENLPRAQDLSQNNLLNGENLTEILSNKIGQRILDQNPDGPVTIGGQSMISVPNAETLAQEFLKEAADRFNPEILYYKVDRNKLLISAENSKEKLTAYLNSADKTKEEQSSNLLQKLNTKSGGLSLDDLPTIISSYEKAVEDFYKLPVPSKALSIHEEEIRLLGTRLNIFLTMRNYDRDPVASILATNEFAQLDEASAQLRKKTDQFIAANQLTK